jgi:hypothetical protein
MQHEEPFFGPAVQRPLSEDDVHELAPELDEVDPELDAPFDPELEPELDFPLDPELEPDEPEEPELPLLPLLPLELEPPSSDEQPETKTMTEDARERTEMMRATFMTKEPLGKVQRGALAVCSPKTRPAAKVARAGVDFSGVEEETGTSTDIVGRHEAWSDAHGFGVVGDRGMQERSGSRQPRLRARGCGRRCRGCRGR